MSMRRSRLQQCVAGGLFALALLPAGALAQTRIPSLDQQDHRGDVGRYAYQKAVERFDGIDADKDGKLSREEVVAKSTYMGNNFERMDADRDNFLSWEEFVGHDRWKKE